MPQFANVLSSLLMSLPLVAVPALAIFGLPSAGSSSAESSEVGVALVTPTSDLGEACDHCESEHHDASDFSFGEIQHAGDGSSEPARVNGSRRVVANAAGARSAIATTSAHQGAPANTNGTLESEPSATEQQGQSDFPWADTQSATDKAVSGESGTSLTSARDQQTRARTAAVGGATGGASSTFACQESLSRLRDLGIKNFRLTNSDVAGKVFFCCSVRTSRNILQRFEAEAATPVAAVNDVLAQVESWQSTR